MPTIGVAFAAISGLNIVLPIFRFLLSIMTLAAAVVRPVQPAMGGDDAAVQKRYAVVDEFFQMPCAPVADDVGSGLPKAGADFLWRRGNDIVEAPMDDLSIAQANEDLGALVGRKRRGEIRLASQLGPFDETKNPGIVDISVIVFFKRT